MLRLIKGTKFWSIERIDQNTFDVTEGEVGAKKVEPKRVAFKHWTKSDQEWTDRLALKKADGWKPYRVKEAIEPRLETALALETLSVWFGRKEYGATAKLADLQGILDGKGLPAVRHLGLANAEFGNEIATAIGSAKITKRLRTLDLSMSSTDDEGAKALAAAKKSLAHLDALDLSRCYLTSAGTALVKELCKRVIVDHQRQPYDWDDEKRRYAAVGE